MIRLLAGLLSLLVALGSPSGLEAAPVEWHSVGSSEAGEQLWDSGSLRLSRGGQLTVLSRFDPATEQEGRQRLGSLYVMELDCDERLYRDTSINGLAQFGAEWQAAADEGLIASVLAEACEAGKNLLASR